MTKYIILIRGINVGGRNKIPMADLRRVLAENGYENLATYIQSGNVVVASPKKAQQVATDIELLLKNNFTVGSEVIRVLVLNQALYTSIIARAPKDFGKDMDRYRYDVMFIIEGTTDEVMEYIETREGVDAVWPGDGVVYYRRPALGHPDATKSRLNKITQKPVYQLLTIRNWNTTKKLLALIEKF